MESLKNIVKKEPGFGKETYSCVIKRDYSIVVRKTKAGLYSVQTDFEEESASQILSTYFEYGKDLCFSPSELDRLPHNLVCSLFSSERERPIVTFLPPLYDTNDRRTPDIWIPGLGFLEIGTSTRGSQVAYDEKMSGPRSYKDACNQRGVSLFVLGIGPDNVTSNFPLLETEVDMIMRAYIFGRQMQMSASLCGFSAGKDDLPAVDELDKCFQELSDEMIPTCDLTITDELWSKWASHSEIEWIYDGLIEESINSVREQIKDKESSYEKDVKLCEDYVKKVHEIPLKPDGYSKKLPIPMAIVDEGHFRDNLEIRSDGFMSEFWMSLLEESLDGYFGKNYEECVDLITTPKEEEEHRLSPEKQATMKSVNRKTMKVSQNVFEELQERGLFAKEVNKQEENTQTEFGYPLDNRLDHSDFDQYLSGGEFFCSERSYHAKPWSLTEKLLVEAGFAETEKSFNLAKAFYKSNLGHALSFLSAVFSEINANIRKPTPKKTFYVNRIIGYKAALAMHNTGFSKHSFYSVIVEKAHFHTDNSLDCFRGWYDIGDYMCTDICSTRRHDVSPLLCISQSALEMFSSSMDVFSSPLTMCHQNRGFKEFLFSLLVKLENANQTSEVLQQVRFCYMKTNSTKLVPMPLLGSLEKFPTIVRSRLCAFSIMRIMEEFKLMSRCQKRVHIQEKLGEEEDYSQDVISGLSSFVSGLPLQNYEEALMLSYLGIYHNKDKTETTSAALQIFVKMTKEELKLTGDKELLTGFSGNIRPSIIPSHGFSSSHMGNCALALLKDLSLRGLEEDDLMRQIASNLDSITFEELSTFKASLSMRHLDIDKSSDEEFQKVFPDIRYDQSDEKRSHGKTCKAVEGVLDILSRIESKEVRPIRVIGELFSLCLRLGGIVTVLFKKGQIGGVREIFILTMIARIMVRFAESVSRTIASFCPNEYLTKGTEKANTTPSHYQKVFSASRSNDKTVHIFDSLDCQTWCQNFTFPAFGSMFAVLTRTWPSLGNMMRCVFNLGSVKRHEMPEVLMNRFIERPNVKSYNESMVVLKNEFLGEGGRLSNGFKSIMVKNVSNFMQGIFHYTSTVVHSGHMTMMGLVMKTYLHKDVAVRSVVHTTKESSDDGSSLLSIIIKGEASKESFFRTRLRGFVASEILSRSYPFMCAKVSDPKSTRLVENGVEEFNSYWSFRNSVLSIPTKFSCAASLLKVSYSSVERLRSDHNALNDCLANGLTMESCKVIEIALAINHYETLGLHTLQLEVWESLVEDILKLSHPGTWFYPSSPRIIGTTMGFDLTLHNLLNKNEKARKTHHVMMKKMSGTFDDKIGLIVQSSIMVGSDKRYKQFLERIQKSVKMEEIDSVVDKNPSMLYRPSIYLDEVKAKIGLKTVASGSKRAFSFEDSCAMHVTSCYLCTSPCLNVSFKENGEWSRMKYSLPAYLTKVLSMISDVEEHTEMDHHANNILNMVSHYSYDLRHIGRRRKIPVKLRFPKTRSSCEESLLSVMSMIWFSIPNGRTLEENIGYMQTYQESHQWLRTSYYDSIEKLRELEIEGNIHYIIRSVLGVESDSDKTVSFLHTGHKTNSMLGTYISCIEYCQRKNCRLIRPDSLFTDDFLGELVSIENSLFPLTAIHPTIRKMLGEREDTLDRVREIFSNNKTLFMTPRSDKELRMLPNRFRKLLSLGKVSCEISSGIQANDVVETITKFSGNTVLTFLVPQRKVESEEGIRWVGHGVVRADLPGCLMIITLFDNKLVSVSMSSSSKVTQYLKIMTKIFKRLRIKEDAGEKINHGVRLNNGVARYSSSKGSPVTQMPWRAGKEKLSRELLASISIDKWQNISLNISMKSKGSIIESDPLLFSPHTSGIGRYTKTLEAKKAIKLILSCDEEKSYTRFVSLSLSQRLTRLGLRKSKRVDRLLRATEIFDDEFHEEDLDFFDDMDFDFDNDISQAEALKASMDMNDDEEIENEFELEDVIDDAKLFSSLQTQETEAKDFSDLTLWDDFISKIKTYTLENFHDLCSGMYRDTLDESSLGNQIITKLWSLNIIPPSIQKIEEDTGSEVESEESDSEVEDIDDSKDVKPIEMKEKSGSREFEEDQYREKHSSDTDNSDNEVVLVLDANVMDIYDNLLPQIDIDTFVYTGVRFITLHSISQGDYNAAEALSYLFVGTQRLKNDFRETLTKKTGLSKSWNVESVASYANAIKSMVITSHMSTNSSERFYTTNKLLENDVEYLLLEDDGYNVVRVDNRFNLLNKVKLITDSEYFNKDKEDNDEYEHEREEDYSEGKEEGEDEEKEEKSEEEEGEEEEEDLLLKHFGLTNLSTSDNINLTHARISEYEIPNLMYTNLKYEIINHVRGDGYCGAEALSYLALGTEELKSDLICKLTELTGDKDWWDIEAISSLAKAKGSKIVEYHSNLKSGIKVWLCSELLRYGDVVILLQRSHYSVIKITNYDDVKGISVPEYYRIRVAVEGSKKLCLDSLLFETNNGLSIEPEDSEDESLSEDSY